MPTHAIPKLERRPATPFGEAVLVGRYRSTIAASGAPLATPVLKC
jgi:hypothetical protein